jgi:tRNA (adenine37-N6)-methyltransferase
MIGLEVIRIGCVRDAGDGRFLLEVLPTYLDALHGLTAGDRVQILFWMHELAHSERRLLRVHPGGDERREQRGVFSLRSCIRPNPIGVSEAEIVEVRATGLLVDGLDAWDGSPLIDIKATSNAATPPSPEPRGFPQPPDGRGRFRRW